MYTYLNKNPLNKRTDDCVIRAISAALDEPWEKVYADICVEGLRFYDMPSANHVWGSYLKKKGFRRFIVPDTCPNCYTVGDFANDHPKGTYILALHNHVVCVKDGCVLDTFDSSDRVPLYYWIKEA